MQNNTSIILDYLDEGTHRFQLQGEYPTGDISDIIEINFNVDAVLGPALIFFPRRHFTTQGNTVTFQVIAEEVYDLTGMEMIIQYNPEHIGVEAVRQGSIFTGFGDVVLDEKWRLISSFQSANGFILFGWSTAFIFEIMSSRYSGF